MPSFINTVTKHYMSNICERLHNHVLRQVKLRCKYAAKGSKVCQKPRPLNNVLQAKKELNVYSNGINQKPNGYF